MLTTVGNWAQKTTCHGIVDLYDSKNLGQKIFWGAVVLTAFGAIVFYQLSVINYYSTVPTATKITKIITDRLRFPLVTICRENPANWQKFLNVYNGFKTRFPAQFSLGTDIDFLAYISFGAGYYPKLAESILYGGSPVEELKYRLIFNSTPPVYDFVQFLNDTSHSCQDFFTNPSKNCRFTSLYFDCCQSATPIRSDFGNCYEIEPIVDLSMYNAESTNVTNVEQMQPGSDWGMILVLNYNFSETADFRAAQIKNEGYEIVIGNIKENEVVSAQLNISLGEQMTKMDTSRVTVAPNQQVSVYLSLQRYEFDPTITTCVDQQADLTQTCNKKKSVLLCKQECVYNITLQMAGCVPVMPNMKLNSSTYCTPSKMGQQFYENAIQFTKPFADAVFLCQQTNCPKLCQMDIYVPFAVYSAATRNNSAVVNIYYGELSYTLIIEKPLMDLAGLISSFGGNLGLFAGMSLITIVQFFAHMLQGCGAALISRIKGKPKIKPAKVEIGIYEGKPKTPDETADKFPSHYNMSRPIYL